MTSTLPPQHSSPATRRGRLSTNAAAVAPLQVSMPAAVFVAPEMITAAATGSHRKKNSDGIPATPDVLISELQLPEPRVKLQWQERDIKWAVCCLVILAATLGVLFSMNRQRSSDHSPVHSTTELGYDYVSRSGCQCTVSIPRGMAVTIKADGIDTVTLAGGPQPMTPAKIRDSEKLVVAETGQYQLVFSSTIGTSAAGTVATFGIYHNNALVPMAHQTVTVGTASSTAGQSIHLTTLKHLVAGDVLDVRGSTTATKKTVSVLCFARSFYAVRLGPL